ncbi:nitrilase family protein [Tunicatimonas pelagia]|uniref:nitrilase family protein n=1 Tax=Tunicatimonas pelagia TaxID=931531 RepID=UPI0026668CF1|nr:nitrilase family protein [Tunicatimonas pelagia]WKN40812.1 nitrilase family protein [Tunicatimonas pelagia]
MKPLRIATAQFEHYNNDKLRNRESLRQLAEQAKQQNAQVVAFHECCLSGYAFVRSLSFTELQAVAEPVPDGESTQWLIQLARELDLTLLAGLFERDEAGKVYNTYVCVDASGLVARYRKLHPFIHPELTPGDEYTTFTIHGWKCGMLICYDNNILENARATRLLGADVLFMPHVTMGTPSTRPGAGFFAANWNDRETDPTSLRHEFDGLKGRAWLMKWLPARAYDNALYAVFSNAIGMDDDQLKNGCSMILDPFGDIIAECRHLGNEVITTTCVPEKLTQAGGYRYQQARRPELYRDIFNQPHTPEQKVVWLPSDSSKK